MDEYTQHCYAGQVQALTLQQPWVWAVCSGPGTQTGHAAVSHTGSFDQT